MRLPSPPSLLALLVGCNRPDVPEDLICEVAVSADATSLAEVLLEGESGDCVVLSGDVDADLDVPAGVVFTGSAAATPVVRGTVTLADGAELHHLTIEGSSGHGVVARGGNTLEDIEISDVAGTGVLVTCEGACDAIDLQRVVETGAENGLAATGDVKVTVGASRFADNSTLTAAGGWGVIAAAGTVLELDDVEVSGNDYGILASDAGTRARLVDLVVVDNAERGIWAQELDGTADEAAFSLIGADTRVEGNGGVGFGAWHTLGIIITNGWFGYTKSIPVQIDVDQTIEMADGIGLYSTTSFVEVSLSAFEQNERAQVLIDLPGNGLDFHANTFDYAASEGQYELVVQGGGSGGSGSNSNAYGVDPTTDVTLPVPAGPVAVPEP